MDSVIIFLEMEPFDGDVQPGPSIHPGQVFPQPLEETGGVHEDGGTPRLSDEDRSVAEALAKGLLPEGLPVLPTDGRRIRKMLPKEVLYDPDLDEMFCSKCRTPAKMINATSANKDR